jgi:tRNA-intron endonuclease
MERVFSEASRRVGSRTLYREAALRRSRMAGVLSEDRVSVEDPTEASTLYNRGYFGRPRSGGGLELDLLEAVYLVEAERLEVRRGGRAVSARDLFRAAGAAVPSFEIRYLVYRDLRQRGYIVESRSGSVDFQVYPRGGAPKKTPSKYWVRALSERAVFDLAELLERAEEAAAVRKTLLLGLVDEESDLTYYGVREAHPRGHRSIDTPKERVVIHFLGDRAVVIEETQARALHEAGFFGKMIGRRLQLSLLETAFLLKGGFAEVRNADTDRPIGLARLTKEAKAIQPDFDLRLRAYEDLTGRGVISKTGFKYGSHFRAYEGDPEAHHAKYLVHVVPKGHRGAWPEISRAVRLAHGVKKQILFGEVGDGVRYVKLERVRP